MEVDRVMVPYKINTLIRKRTIFTVHGKYLVREFCGRIADNYGTQTELRRLVQRGTD